VNGTANIDTEKYIAADKNKTGIYIYFTALTKPGEGILGFYGLLNIGGGKNTDRAVYIMNKLFEYFKYKSGVTNISTTAEDACLLGVGVCQDYAHIYISLLRAFSIPARYVCGLIVGEGQSHAWVEAVCDGSFIAFDPTHNREITDEYIKLGVGRDATDCAINRGVMWGGGLQTQEIECIVEKYY
jgi:transglutaminase-like putative cysteine protease